MSKDISEIIYRRSTNNIAIEGTIYFKQNKVYLTRKLVENPSYFLITSEIGTQESIGITSQWGDCFKIINNFNIDTYDIC